MWKTTYKVLSIADIAIYSCLGNKTTEFVDKTYFKNIYLTFYFFLEIEKYPNAQVFMCPYNRVRGNIFTKAAFKVCFEK